MRCEIINYNRVTRSDVAKLAGVSEATVSFVISKKRYVSEELSNRVMDAVEKLNYKPDYIARSLVTKTTDTIVVLTSDIASPLQMCVIKSIQNEAMKKNFFVNVCGGTENLQCYVDNFISRRIDGIFISVDPNLISDEDITRMLDAGISVLVTSTRHVNDDRVCGLELDFAYGMEKIVEHLASLGHKNIAYLSCFTDDMFYDKRLPAFRRMMKKYLNNSNPLVYCCDPPYESTIETGKALCDKLIADGKKFDAVIASNDLMTMGALDSLREHGISCPLDVSVVGIDDIPFAKAFNPPLTTLSHMSEEYGKKIFNILYANIKDKNNIGREVVLPQLIVRKTTQCVK